MDDQRAADEVDVAEASCNCDTDATVRAAADVPVTDRWNVGPTPLDEPLPVDVQVGLGRLLGRDSVERLSEWVAAARASTGGGAIAIDDLCHASDESGHWADVHGDRYHFLCFYDAVILSALLDGPVDIRTESPDGSVVEAAATGEGELRVTPAGAVFSFGVDAAVEPPVDGGPSSLMVYAAVCPYVQAFPGRDAYERWAATVPAATVAMPLAGATDLATALVE